MDLSKLPDSQRQELEQLQKQFHEHQKQQQESAAAAAAVQPPPYDSFQAVHQPYVPSQPYDPSYYYNYHDPSQQQPPPPRPHYDANPYYQNYYPNSYQQPPPPYNDQQRNAESGPLGLGRPYGNPGYPGPSGLNPTAAVAAVAALSHLTQFAGGMGAPPMPGGHYDPGHFRPPVGHPPYNGGRRGGGLFRGGGHGNPGFRSPNAGASGPPFRGRGRGRGSGRGRGRAGRRGPASSNPESSAQPPVRTAWCEVCKIDCTTDEVLNVHNNGKRHKKNLQKLQRLKSAGAVAVADQPVVQTEKDEKPASDVASEVQENVPETKTEPDKQTEAGGDNEKLETEKNEIDNQEKKERMARKMRRGTRGVRGGRVGAKRMRMAGPRIRKGVMPLMCDLCNIKCDTQEVFDRHAAGKKHRAKVKRFEGHQAMYGPTAVQALYPPNPLSQTLGPQPPPAYTGASSSYLAPPPPLPEAYVPPPYQAQNPNPQLADAPLEFGTQNAVLSG